MKRILTSLFAFIVSITLFAQAPNVFNYQGLARDLAGNPITNKNIGLRVSILQGSPTGGEVYKETQQISTNNLGLFNIQIGRGTPVYGEMASISWGMGIYHLKIEMDENGGSNYQHIGTSQLLSVPYALYSLSSGDTCKWSSNQEKLFYNMGNVGIGTNTPTVDFEIISTPGKAIRGMALNQYSDDRNGQMLLLRKWRGNSIAPLPLINNDYTGALVFTGFNGTTPSITTPIGTAIIGGRINGTPSSSSLPQDLFFSTSNTSTNNDPYLMNTVRMVISSTGNVGIGTINPQQKLHINDVMRLEPRSTAPTSPSQGDIYFDNTLNKLRVYDGTQWQECW